MTRCVYALIVVCVLWSFPVYSSEPAKTIQLGVFPYVSSEKLIRLQTPLKKLLTDTLQQPVTLVSAPDFPTFVTRTAQGKYDYILTAPHFARLAELDNGYQRIAETIHRVQGVFIVREDSGIDQLQQLNNETIMIAQRLSILFQLSKQQLMDFDLYDAENISILETRTHNNAMLAPLRFESTAAVVGNRLFERLAQPQRDQLKIIAKTPSAPGIMLMAHQTIAADRITLIQDRLVNFSDTTLGEKYFQSTGWIGFTEINDNTMQSLDQYTKIARTFD